MIPGPEIGFPAFNTSNCVSFSKYAISLSESVDLVSFMACAIILSETYSIQAWFSGGLPCFLMKSATKLFRSRGIDIVMPDRRPRAAQIAFAGRPRIRRVEIESDDGVGQSEFGILLDQIGDLIAGQVAADDVRPGLPHLQQIGTEIGHVGGDQLIAHKVASLAAKNALAA